MKRGIVFCSEVCLHWEERKRRRSVSLLEEAVESITSTLGYRCIKVKDSSFKDRTKTQYKVGIRISYHLFSQATYHES